MSDLPRVGTVLGVWAALFYRFLDPRRREMRLIEAKRRILEESFNEARSRKLAWIDDQLIRVREEIRLRAS